MQLLIQLLLFRMLRFNHKILVLSRVEVKAFSLIEVMVALALSSTLLMVGYVSFQFIFKQFSIFKKTSVQTLNNDLFYTYLLNDINKAEKITSIRDGITCNNKAGNVNYYWQEGELVRVFKQSADTFHIKSTSPLFFMDSVPVSSNDQLISLITFDATVKNNKVSVKLTKEYGADNGIVWKDE
jgi:prepilin-type N-terminal cleavage/methylation domain-containing protein